MLMSVSKGQLILDNHLGGCVKGGDPDTYDENVWNYLIENYEVHSILDIGCGEGWSTEFFKRKGLKVLGIEGSRKVINDSPHKELLIQHDYTLGKIKLKEKYDAVWTCEFVEHVEERFVENFLDTFANVKYVFMTYSEPQWSNGGYHHVNCRDQKYWNSKLESINFSYLEEETKYIRSIAKARWIKSTLSIYQKNDSFFKKVILNVL